MADPIFTMPDGSTNWFEVIRSDMRVLAQDAWAQIDKDEQLLRPQAKIAEDDPMREMAPLARRIDKFVRELGSLRVPPWLDAEYSDRVGKDISLRLEAFQEQLANRLKLTKVVSKAHRICTYAPLVFLKTGMPRTVVWQRGFDAVSTGIAEEPSMDGADGASTNAIRLDEVPPDDIPALDLSEVAQMTPEIAARAEVNDMPSLSNMVTPRCEVVDPRHVVTDPYIGDLDEAYYIAHFAIRTPQQLAAEYDNVQLSDYVGRQIASRDDSVNLQGITAKSFRPMTNQEIVIICEVYIRQDPSKPENTGLHGVMDFDTGKWIQEPQKLFLPNRWVVIRADESKSQMWQGSSYIGMAYDDMLDRAFVRRSVREHTAWSAHDAFWIPESMKIDAETVEEIEAGKFTRKIVRYGGPRVDLQQSHLRPVPTALLQYDQIADASFARNTGATGTSQGQGASNKVATAFNQEQAFLDKREADMLDKLFEAYRSVMLIATWLVMNYGSSRFVLANNGISFTMNRDDISGIANYTISAVNRSQTDPFAARLLLVQQLKELFSNPQLLQYFNPEEVAKLIAQASGWPGRVMARKSGQGPAQTPEGDEAGGGSSTNSGTSSPLGSGVDSEASTSDNTGAAVAGAGQRGT